MTTEVVAFPGAVHIDEKKDFTPVIEKALELGGTDQGVQLAHFHGKAPLLLRFLNYNFIFMNLNHAYVYVKLKTSTRQVKFWRIMKKTGCAG